MTSQEAADQTCGGNDNRSTERDAMAQPPNARLATAARQGALAPGRASVAESILANDHSVHFAGAGIGGDSGTGGSDTRTYRLTLLGERFVHQASAIFEAADDVEALTIAHAFGVACPGTFRGCELWRGGVLIIGLAFAAAVRTHRLALDGVRSDLRPSLRTQRTMAGAQQRDGGRSPMHVREEAAASQRVEPPVWYH
jgi:hypothetical protein